MASTTLPEQQTIRISPALNDSRLGDSTIGSARSPEINQWIEKFDGIYRDAAGNIDLIPWAHRQPCPFMVSWLNAVGPGLIRPGARVAVVGCGLGEDACELAERGYDVTAFDACPSAVEWAQRLHPDHADIFMQADAIDPPTRLVHRFDFIVEIHTLQSLPPAHRHDLAAGMSRLLSPRGVLLAIARGRDESVPLSTLDGPPFPFTAKELTDLMGTAGLSPLRPVDDFTDDCTPPVRRLRGAFHRG